MYASGEFNLVWLYCSGLISAKQSYELKDSDHNSFLAPLENCLKEV